ncbi:hypothetical protein DY000_02058849 [Brassica cretica]|uniref:DUF1985 domain-containing protein n=1 Tax=Brassica cretica TaxID=69181 RepID=A0ABQ7AY21_BRACR|nr:hypothetical protein DY000_02058849 [Brassica cretica]
MNPPILIDVDPLSSQNSGGSHIKIPNEILTIQTGESSRPDQRLPERLFATNIFPRKRLNIYSKPGILCFIKHTLQGSQEFEVIRRSCFGGLFNLPARQCPVSHKLIHSLLSRQILVLSQHTLWPVVAGNPFRFSLAEFQTITGLPCGPFPEHYQSPSFNTRNAAKDPLWQKLLGHDSLITVKTYRLQGFPLALQLVAFQAMPLLAIKIPAAPNPATLLELEDPHLPLHKSLSINDFEVAEADPKLRVITLIPLADNAPLWGDEPEDERVRYMEELIAQNHEFHIRDWPGAIHQYRSSTSNLLSQPFTGNILFQENSPYEPEMASKRRPRAPANRGGSRTTFKRTLAPLLLLTSD